MNNADMSLRDLKRAATGLHSEWLKLHIGLYKKHNTMDVRFRPRPAGLTGVSALCASIFHQAHETINMGKLSKCRLDCEHSCKPERCHHCSEVP